MQLSKRLQAVADFVTKGNRVADIGCDHAYITIYLLEKGIAPYVVAMDVNPGPLDRAKANIEKYGYQEQCSIRLSNGTQQLTPGEVDTLLIAGMGGGLMLQILTGNVKVLQTVRELILQPQSEIYLVRRTLKNLGFYITAEQMLMEEGKYYVCMRAERFDPTDNSVEHEKMSKVEYHFGKFLLEKQDPVLHQFLKKELKQYEEILISLQGAQKASADQRKEEVIEEMELIRTAMSYYKEETE